MNRDVEIIQVNHELDILRARYETFERSARMLKIAFYGVASRRSNPDPSRHHQKLYCGHAGGRLFRWHNSCRVFGGLAPVRP